MKKIENKTVKTCCWNCQFILTPDKIKLRFKKKLERIEKFNDINKQRERIIEDAR